MRRRRGARKIVGTPRLSQNQREQRAQATASDVALLFIARARTAGGARQGARWAQTRGRKKMLLRVEQWRARGRLAGGWGATPPAYQVGRTTGFHAPGTTCSVRPCRNFWADTRKMLERPPARPSAAGAKKTRGKTSGRYVALISFKETNGAPGPEKTSDSWDVFVAVFRLCCCSLTLAAFQREDVSFSRTNRF